MLGLLAAAATFLVLLAIAAPLTDSATDTLESSNRSWLVACVLAGLIAGFLGDRVARSAPSGARYAAAIGGPAALALLFALTTSAADQSGVWAAFVLSIGAAALGAFGRERVASAQRRR
jgi:FtsH-binding integral membrane protein